jgi:hypothetical protein
VKDGLVVQVLGGHHGLDDVLHQILERAVAHDVMDGVQAHNHQGKVTRLTLFCGT